MRYCSVIMNANVYLLWSLSHQTGRAPLYCGLHQAPCCFLLQTHLRITHSSVTYHCLKYSVIPPHVSFSSFPSFKMRGELLRKALKIEAKRLLYIWGEKLVTTTISKQHGLSNSLSNFCIAPQLHFSMSVERSVVFIKKLSLAENQSPP